MKKSIKTMLTRVSILLGIILVFIMITSSNTALKKPITTQKNIPSQPQKIYSGSGVNFISSFKELKIVENGIIPASSQNPQVAITRTTYKGKAEIVLSTAYSNLKPNLKYPCYQTDLGEVIVFIEANNLPYAKIIRLGKIVFQ